MEPRIVQKEAFTVVGLAYSGKNENQEIGVLWRDFSPRVGEIEHISEPNVYYGLCLGISENGEFEYLAGAPVSQVNNIPEGMVAREVASRKYAVFTHRGPVEKAPETYDYIFGTWLPASGYEYTPAPGFEYYGSTFDPLNPEFDLYIPLK